MAENPLLQASEERRRAHKEKERQALERQAQGQAARGKRRHRRSRATGKTKARPQGQRAPQAGETLGRTDPKWGRGDCPYCGGAKPIRGHNRKSARLKCWHCKT